MSVLPCFVLFVAVYGTAAIESFDNFQMELFYKQLVDQGVISVDPDIYNTLYKYVSCTVNNNNIAQGFFDCYEHMQNDYANIQEMAILESIKKEVLSMMFSYNKYVWSYMSSLKLQSYILDVKPDAIQSITFKESKLHCVAEFFRRFNKNDYAKSLLDDYFFYYQFDTVPNIEKKEVFFERLNVVFGRCKNEVLCPAGGFEGALETAKNNINHFSEPFCKLQYDLDQKNNYGDKWLWKALQNSSILPKVYMDGQNIYDYKGLKANTTLREVFNDMHKITGYDSAVNHYGTITNILKMYVLKVLIRKMLYIVTNAMQLYYIDVGSLKLNNAEDKIKFVDRKSTQIYALQIFLAFNYSVAMFATNFLDIKTKDAEYLIDTMDVTRANFTRHTVFSIAMDPKPKIDLINKRLNYDNLKLIPDADQNSIDHYSGTNEKTVYFDDLIKELERMNYLLTHIVEIKKNYS